MKGFLIVFRMLFVFVFAIMAVAQEDVDFLLLQAGAAGRPSVQHNSFMDQVFLLAQKIDVAGLCEERLSQNKYPGLHELYLRTIAVIGDANGLASFVTYFSRRAATNDTFGLFDVYSFLGVLGDGKAQAILEKQLNRNQANPVLNFAIARSLFLLTGQRYRFVNPDGNLQEFYPTEAAIRARTIILASRGRKRTFEEMRTLDGLFR